MTLPNGKTDVNISTREAINNQTINRVLSNLYENDEYISSNIGKVQVSSTDDEMGYIDSKIIAGSDITIKKYNDKLLLSSEIDFTVVVDGVITSGNTSDEHFAVFATSGDVIKDSTITENNLNNVIQNYEILVDDVTQSIAGYKSFYDTYFPGYLYSSKDDVANKVYLHNDKVYSTDVDYDQSKVHTLYELGFTPYIYTDKLKTARTINTFHEFIGYIVSDVTGVSQMRILIPFKHIMYVYLDDTEILAITSQQTSRTYTLNLSLTANVYSKLKIKLRKDSSSAAEMIVSWKSPTENSWKLTEFYFTYSLYYELNPKLAPGGV